MFMHDIIRLLRHCLSRTAVDWIKEDLSHSKFGCTSARVSVLALVKKHANDVVVVARDGQAWLEQVDSTRPASTNSEV